MHTPHTQTHNFYHKIYRQIFIDKAIWKRLCRCEIFMLLFLDANISDLSFYILCWTFKFMDSEKPSILFLALFYIRDSE